MSGKLKLKNFVQKLFNKFGLHLSRKKDDFRLEVYQELIGEKKIPGQLCNIGSGSFYHPFWTNYDFVSDWYKDAQREIVHIDLTSEGPLPIEDQTAKVIYSSHVIEHLPNSAVQVFFNNVYHALEKGGIFRVTTGPDSDTNYRALQLKDHHWFYWDTKYETKGNFEHIYHQPTSTMSLEERWLHHFAAPLVSNDITHSKIKYNTAMIREEIARHGYPQVLDFFTKQCTFDPKRPGNHINWFNYQKIEKMLCEAGFNNVYQSGYGQSVSPLMRNSDLFDSRHPQMSIYVEAIK